MPWTQEDRVRYLVSLPWTVTLTNDTDCDLAARVSELPFLIATGRTEKETARDLFEGLWSALDAMMTHGDPVPLPRGTYLPWERGEEPMSIHRFKHRSVAIRGDAWGPTASAVAQSLALHV